MKLIPVDAQRCWQVTKPARSGQARCQPQATTQVDKAQVDKAQVDKAQVDKAQWNKAQVDKGPASTFTLERCRAST